MASTIRLYGYNFEQDEKKKGAVSSFVPKEPDEGEVLINWMNSFTGAQASYLDLDGAFKNQSELIEKYRNLTNIPEIDFAVDEIVSEAIVTDEKEPPISIDLTDLEVSDKIKEKIEDAFKHIMDLLDFKLRGHDLFRRWYIDGCIYYHMMIDHKKPKLGIQEVRFVDPRKLKKIRQLKNNPDTTTGVSEFDSMLETGYEEYYLYTETFEKKPSSHGAANFAKFQQEIKIAPDAIATANSGRYDSNRNMIQSYLHKALRIANNLKLLEDSIVIYRLSRAPERRIFYIDVGTLPRTRARQYMQNIMAKYKSKLVYNAETGEVQDSRRHLAMTEDYWIPRREGSRGTEIDTLQGGQNLGQIEDVEYFLEKMFRSLNVPLSRFKDDTGSLFSGGSEITRDELRFAKSIVRMRNRFVQLLDTMLCTQLVLTQVMSVDYWNAIKQDIHYDFLRDNYYKEIFETRVWTDRFNLLREAQEYSDTYLSRDWINKQVLRFTDEEVRELQKQREKEKTEFKEEIENEKAKGGGGFGDEGGPFGGGDEEKEPSGSASEGGNSGPPSPPASAKSEEPAGPKPPANESELIDLGHKRLVQALAMVQKKSILSEDDESAE